MAYAIRYSPNIQADLRRGWSAWMGIRAASLYELCDNTPDLYDLTEYVSDPDDTDAIYDYLDLVERRSVGAHYEPAEDTEAPAEVRWCWKHHDGLACYALDAETEAEALAQAAEWDTDALSSGQGWLTEGEVKVVAELGNGWYLLECDDLSREP